MDQTRPVSGFEGFPGTDPGHPSTGWGKCYQNMNLSYFHFSFGSLGPSDMESEVLCQTECSDSQVDLSVMRALIWHCNRNIIAVSSGLWGVILDSNGLLRSKALEHGAFVLFFEFLWDIVIFLQAHSHVKKLLSNAPVESVVRVTGIVSSRPPGQENPVRMLGSLRGCIPCGKEHWIVGLWWVLCHSFAVSSRCVTTYPQIMWGEITAMRCNLGEPQSTLDTHELNCIPALWKDNG